MILNGNLITADTGKVFIRKETNENMGKEIYLGYSYYIGGILLNPPHKDTISDFEEIDDSTLTTEEIDIIETVSDNNALLRYVNEETNGAYTDLGSAVIDLVNNKLNN